MAGGKTRNHGCAQAFSSNNPVNKPVKGPAGAFIPAQGLKGAQIGFAIGPFGLAQFHIVSCLRIKVVALYPLQAF
jgi:hypothetical protein